VKASGRKPPGAHRNLNRIATAVLGQGATSITRDAARRKGVGWMRAILHHTCTGSLIRRLRAGTGSRGYANSIALSRQLIHVRLRRLDAARMSAEVTASPTGFAFARKAGCFETALLEP
jgi:hypothetical protein